MFWPWLWVSTRLPLAFSVAVTPVVAVAVVDRGDHPGDAGRRKSSPCRWARPWFRCRGEVEGAAGAALDLQHHRRARLGGDVGLVRSAPFTAAGQGRRGFVRRDGGLGRAFEPLIVSVPAVKAAPAAVTAAEPDPLYSAVAPVDASRVLSPSCWPRCCRSRGRSSGRRSRRPGTARRRRCRRAD